MVQRPRDYTKVAELLQSAADRLVEACFISEATGVLDVAAGTWKAAMAAAKKGATVVASDLTPTSIRIGEGRGRQEGVDIEWFEADAKRSRSKPTDLNNLIKHIKRVAFGLRRFRNHRIRVVLYARRPNWDPLATVTPC